MVCFFVWAFSFHYLKKDLVDGKPQYNNTQSKNKFPEIEFSLSKEIKGELFLY